MQAWGLNMVDKLMAETMRQRVTSSLRGLRERGSVLSGDGHGASLIWRLAE